MQLMQSSFAEALSKQQKVFEQQVVSLREEIQAIKSRPQSPELPAAGQPTAGTEENGASNNGLKPAEPPAHLQTPSTTTPSSTPDTAPPRPTAYRPASPKRSERLPDPPMFTGQRKDLPLFVTKLRFKLEGNSDRYPDERSKLIYAHSRLERDPATLIDSMIDRDIHTVDSLIAFLQATYDDPNKELSAWSKLDTLKQGKKRFLSHFAEFRRLVSDTDLNESAQINHLRRTLSDDLRRAMVGIPVPHNLNEYANLISLYDNDLRYLPPRHALRPSYATAAKRDPDAMEIDSSNYAPVGSAERQKRIKNGTCFRCNSKDHISPNCPIPWHATRSSSLPRSSSKDATALARRRNSDSSVSSAASSTVVDRRPRSRTPRRKNNPSPKGKSRA